jgi:hypothetical protein
MVMLRLRFTGSSTASSTNDLKSSYRYPSISETLWFWCYILRSSPTRNMILYNTFSWSPLYTSRARANTSSNNWIKSRASFKVLPLKVSGSLRRSLLTGPLWGAYPENVVPILLLTLVIVSSLPEEPAASVCPTLCYLRSTSSYCSIAAISISCWSMSRLRYMRLARSSSSASLWSSMTKVLSLSS